MGKAEPHVVVIPWPAQGHVNPLMEFSLRLVEHGCRVTFLNTESNHNRIMNNACKEKEKSIGDNHHHQLRLVSIPGEDFHQDKNKTGVIWPFILQNVEDFMEEIITSSDGNGIACLVVDLGVGWGPEIAAKMGIPLVVFFPGSALWLALGLTLPKLIDDGGIVDCDGTPLELQKMIHLSPTAPAINTQNFPWVRLEGESAKRTTFEIMLRSREVAGKADWFFCNSSHDLEPAALSLIPKLMPIGPLRAPHRNSAGNFWPEDQTCLEWLDQQPPCSVIYAAFGSFTIFNQTQFQELALGLELSNIPFLWVVRPESGGDGKTDDQYPEGFQDRVGNRGRIVGWAPQKKVLGHPSVACFLSHCGWNSTVEGVTNGIPFLCWPYSADQFINESYICDVWKTGLGFNPDEDGYVTREEIKNKVGQLLGDQEFRSRALHLKEKAMGSVKEGGTSYNNFNKFVRWLKT